MLDTKRIMKENVFGFPGIFHEIEYYLYMEGVQRVC